MSEITLDIETVPSQQEGFRDSIKVTAPGQYKNPESIEKWLAAEGEAAKEDVYRKTSFDGLYGEIACISYQLDDGEIFSFSRDFGGSEYDLLDELFESLAGKRLDKWIGHYITGFDLRFLFKRCVVNRVRPTVMIPYGAKPWAHEVFDTCIEWSGTQKTGASSLDDVSKGLGYEGKKGMTGADVWDYWKAGRINEIVEYCEDDVRMTRNIYKRMNFL